MGRRHGLRDHAVRTRRGGRPARPCTALVVPRSARRDVGAGRFVGSVVAFILPAHIAIAVLAFVGVGILCAIGLVRSLMARRLPDRGARLGPARWSRRESPSSRPWSGGWSRATPSAGARRPRSPRRRPSIRRPSSPRSMRRGVSPWRSPSSAPGVFLAIPVGLVPAPPRSAVPGRPLPRDASASWRPVRSAGAARLSDFTMFYLYFAGIAVFATPIAVAAVLDGLGAPADDTTSPAGVGADRRLSDPGGAGSHQRDRPSPGVRTGRRRADPGQPARTRSSSCPRTPSSPIHAGRSTRSRSERRSSSASTRTQAAESCRCASRPNSRTLSSAPPAPTRSRASSSEGLRRARCIRDAEAVRRRRP